MYAFSTYQQPTLTKTLWKLSNVVYIFVNCSCFSIQYMYACFVGNIKLRQRWPYYLAVQRCNVCGKRYHNIKLKKFSFHTVSLYQYKNNGNNSRIYYNTSKLMLKYLYCLAVKLIVEQDPLHSSLISIIFSLNPFGTFVENWFDVN